MLPMNPGARPARPHHLPSPNWANLPTRPGALAAFQVVIRGPVSSGHRRRRENDDVPSHRSPSSTRPEAIGANRRKPDTACQGIARGADGRSAADDLG